MTAGMIIFKAFFFQRTSSCCNYHNIIRLYHITWFWNISHQSWQQEASDWDSWRSSVRKASCEFEAERHKATKQKRRRQKEQAASLPSSSQTFVYPKCGTGSASRIGLYSHQWLCKNWPSTFPTIIICEEWATIIIRVYHITWFLNITNIVNASCIIRSFLTFRKSLCFLLLISLA